MVSLHRRGLQQIQWDFFFNYYIYFIFHFDDVYVNVFSGNQTIYIILNFYNFNKHIRLEVLYKENHWFSYDF